MKKNILNYKIGAIRFLALVCISIVFMFSSCNSDDDGSTDTTAPTQVANVTFKPNNGGGTFFYDVPVDEDILFVKAVYTLDNNETIYRASSFYADSLGIEGLGSVKPYNVKLVSVDRTGNESAPVTQEITPLTPSTDVVLDGLIVIPSFSSVYVSWENPQRKNMVIGVTYEVDGHSIVAKYATNDLKDNFLIDNLDIKAYNFTVDIADDFGNVTGLKEYNDITPFSDQLLDKTKFTFLRDELLPDSMNETWVDLDESGQEVTMTRTLLRAEKEGGYKGELGDEINWNARERSLDGEIQLFWDGIIDDGILRNKNFFSTGITGTIPFSYYIDLGEEVQMSRFKVWQRDWDYRKSGADQSGYAYDGENVEIFELWISNDKVNWERVRRANIVKPFDEVEAREEVLAGHHFIAYPENPQFTKTFRYLEYRGLKRFDGGTSVCVGSEISIFGNSVN
ncbi:DUF4959 domain-containing protein [Algibacter miyuki]|uniref:DUF4959 domain-containing protein n=1 Tax=Algibacter miyuki TaxID=1306933 RepID=A0ABV5H313_9FLAO|nr:DUF4959 domain-containing protein [Algibacter miyuki]MDN3665357.1 DUF4959 domain-containing protein [Algibacter miyuki]MDN3667637.1 DUF4959 domain-containing protein [Algibacter miyuki]